MKIREDCRHYRGDIPCSKRKVCWSCDEHAPIGRRALVVKFGAPGDALRTTPLLSRLRKEGFAEITWISDKASIEVLSLARNIDRLIAFGPEALALAMTERFDAVFSLDKDPSAIAIAMLADSADKRGFSQTDAGRLTVFTESARYAQRLGIDDDLKFRENRKTVPELMFEISGYEYSGEEYELDFPRSAKSGSGRRVALNVGVGPRWPTKGYPENRWRETALLLMKSGYGVSFVGGPAEEKLAASLAASTGAEFIPPAPLARFAATLADHAAVVTADSLGLHIGLAAGTRVVGLFCATTSAEIEWYGRGTALVAERGPCYNGRCPNWPGCMAEIAPSRILEALRGLGA